MNIYPTKKYGCYWLFLGLLPALLCATVKADDSVQKDEPLPSLSILEPLDKPRDVISRQVINFADWIDTFFAGDRVYDELQESHVKLYIQQTYFDNNGPSYYSKLKVKLVFPKTEKRLKLLIEDEEDEDEETAQQSITDVTEGSDQAVGLRYVEKKTKLWRIHSDALIRRRSEWEVIGRFRVRRRFENGPWIYRLSEYINWISTDGLIEKTRLDIDHTLAKKFLFRSSTFATWKNKNGYFDYGQDFLVFQNINKRKALTYQAGISAITENRPHIINYNLSIRYREQVHKGWLFYEIIPAINFPIEEDHNPVKSIAFRLEAVFNDD